MIEFTRASMTGLPTFAAVLLVLVLGAALIEGIVKTWCGAPFDWRAYGCSLVDLLGRRAIELLSLSLVASLLNFVWVHRLFDIPSDRAWTLPVLFVGQEFCYYWYHRASHSVRWLWATHAVHHSPNQLNFAAAYRLGWTGKLAGGVIFFAPLTWLGFPPLAVVAALGINLLYQFWLHADWIPKLGPLEWVLNTPSHHRVHHAANIDYLDANFGGVLVVFDRLFGTYVEEQDDVPICFGLVRPLVSYNPLYIAFHEWLAMVRDLRHARSWREAWNYLFGPPGWQPDGGTTTAALRRARNGSQPTPRMESA